MKQMQSIGANDALSALYDGQLSAAQARALVRDSLRQSLADGGETLATWRSYSQASDALQTAAPTTLLTTVSEPVTVVRVQADTASNDSIFRWKIVASVAAIAAVGSLAWNMSESTPSSAAVIAQQAPAGEQQALMLRDPRLDAQIDALRAAHRQFGGISALQQGAGALHTVNLVSTRP